MGYDLWVSINDSHNFCFLFDLLQTLDVGLDIDYDGGFQLAVDVDIVLQTWAYLSIKVTKLCGKARLQLTRIPFTHWSFSFYEVWSELSGNKNISILHLSCRTSHLQFSLVLQTHAFVL